MSATQQLSADSIARLTHAREFIAQHCDELLDLDRIASEAGYSRFHFLRRFRAAFGVTPHQYLTHCRLERAKQLLASGGHTVTEVCMAVGFSSLGSFSTLFSKRVGHAPALHRAIVLEAQDRRMGFVPWCFLVMSGSVEQGLQTRAAISEKTAGA